MDEILEMVGSFELGVEQSGILSQTNYVKISLFLKKYTYTLHLPCNKALGFIQIVH